MHANLTQWFSVEAILGSLSVYEVCWRTKLSVLVVLIHPKKHHTAWGEEQAHETLSELIWITRRNDFSRNA